MVDVHKASRALARNQPQRKSARNIPERVRSELHTRTPEGLAGKSAAHGLADSMDCRERHLHLSDQRFWRRSRRTTSQAGNVEFQQHMTWIKSVAWQMGMPSWPRRRTERHISSWRATKDPGRCERPYAGGCDHLLERKDNHHVSDLQAVAAARQAACFEF